MSISSGHFNIPWKTYYRKLSLVDPVKWIEEKNVNESTVFKLANLSIYKRFQSIHLYYTDINLDVRVSLCPPIQLPTHPPTHQPIWHPSTHSFSYIYPPTHLPSHLPTHPPIHPPIPSSTHPLLSHPSAHPSPISLPIHPSTLLPADLRNCIYR